MSAPEWKAGDRAVVEVGKGVDQGGNVLIKCPDRPHMRDLWYVPASALSPLPADGLGPVTPAEAEIAWRAWNVYGSNALYGAVTAAVNAVLAARAAQQPGVDAASPVDPVGLGARLMKASADWERQYQQTMRASDEGRWTAVARSAIRECGRVEAKTEPNELREMARIVVLAWQQNFNPDELAEDIWQPIDMLRQSLGMEVRGPRAVAPTTGYCERVPAGEYEEALVATGEEPRHLTAVMRRLQDAFHSTRRDAWKKVALTAYQVFGHEPPVPGAEVVAAYVASPREDAQPPRPAQIAEANARVADRAEGAEQARAGFDRTTYDVKGQFKRQEKLNKAEQELRDALAVRRAILAPPPTPDAVGELVAAVQATMVKPEGWVNYLAENAPAVVRLRAAIAAVKAQREAK